MNRIDKVMAPQNKRGKNSKKQTTIATKASSQTPNNILFCCFIAITIQR
jgi:hypothetical protein